MSNTDTEIGDRYWDATYLDSASLLARGIGTEGSPDEPPKFKRYLDRSLVALPQRMPTALGRVDDAICGRGPLTDLSDTDVLGRLLYFGYGLSRVDVGPVSGWPFHRLVPSARCFYPTELYLVVGSDGALEAGVYHYDQAHHALVLLRPGDHRDYLRQSLGQPRGSSAGGSTYAVVTSHFWKTAFRYRHYAYRLCTQEAGMVIGNLLMVAGTFGHRPRVHVEFLDEAVDHLLGLPAGVERTMAVLGLDETDDPAPVRTGGSASELCGLVPPIEAPSRMVVESPDLAGDLYEMDAHSILRGPDELALTEDDAKQADSESAAQDRPGAGGELIDALRDRHSGGTLFRPSDAEITGADLAGVLSHVGVAYRSDAGQTPFARAHVVVQRSPGLAAGVYREVGGHLVQIGPEVDRLDLKLQYGPPVVDLSRTAALCYLVGHRHRLRERYGNRGYRIANLDAGVLAQRLCVLAGGRDIAARPFNGYAVEPVLHVLGVTDPGAVPLFQIALGRRTMSAQYEMPIVF